MKIAFKLYFLCEIWTRILFYRWNYVNNYYLFESCMIIWQNIWVWLCLHPILEVDKSGHTKVDMWDCMQGLIRVTQNQMGGTSWKSNGVLPCLPPSLPAASLRHVWKRRRDGAWFREQRPTPSRHLYGHAVASSLR